MIFKMRNNGTRGYTGYRGRGGGDPRRWLIVLLALGSPIWLSLLIAAAAVVLSLYIVLWSLILSLWAVELSLAVAALAGVTAAENTNGKEEWRR